MNLRAFKIGTRLAVGFGSILLILVVMVVLTNILNGSNKADLMSGMEKSYGKSELVATMKSAMLETGIAMRNIGLQSDVGIAQNSLGLLNAQQLLVATGANANDFSQMFSVSGFGTIGATPTVAWG